jgi:hypothetical protein
MQQVVLIKVIGFSRSEGFEAGTPIASFRGDAALRSHLEVKRTSTGRQGRLTRSKIPESTLGRYLLKTQ